jgi:hypothetical protein
MEKGYWIIINNIELKIFDPDKFLYTKESHFTCLSLYSLSTFALGNRTRAAQYAKVNHPAAECAAKEK